MAHFRHRWLRPAEQVRWHGSANRGPGDTRQVGGHLFVTDQRLVFVPLLAERFAQEPGWEAPIDQIAVTIGEGAWSPQLPILRDIALRYEVTVTSADGTVATDAIDEHFFLAHLAAPLVSLAANDRRTA